MKKIQIKLSSIEDVRNFVNVLGKYDIDMDLHSGRYTVDAKSLMGIFSLDLLNAIEFVIHSDDAAKTDAVLKDVKQFIV